MFKRVKRLCLSGTYTHTYTHSYVLDFYDDESHYRLNKALLCGRKYENVQPIIYLNLLHDSVYSSPLAHRSG